MRARVLWPAIGRCALVAASLSSLTFLGGCSSGVSRFDFPSFGLARSSEPEPLADPNATASLPPVPQESIYAQGGQGNYQSPYQNGSYSRSTLPPPNGYPNGSYAQSSQPPAQQAYNQPTPAAYAPPTQLKPQKVNYAPTEPAPRSSLSKVRAASGTEETYKVQAGDTPSSIAAKTGVSVKALVARNDLKPPRLKVGEVLYLPKGSKPAPPRRRCAKEISRARRPGGQDHPDCAARQASSPGEAASRICCRCCRRGRRRRPEPASGKQSRASGARAYVRQQLPLAGAGTDHLRIRHQARWRPQ